MTLGPVPVGPAGQGASSALPGPAAVPAHVRADGPEAVATYRAALGFERMLLMQLLETAKIGASEGEEGGDAAAGAYQDLMPQTLADSLASGGGLGLADELYRSIRMETR